MHGSRFALRSADASRSLVCMVASSWPENDRSRPARRAPSIAAATGTEAIAATYFPLDLSSATPDSFDGELTIWAVRRRVALAAHLRGAALPPPAAPFPRPTRDEEFLITVPARSEVFFSQCGKDVRCAPGGFILERSHEPYEFSHAEPADLWVLKIEAQALADRVRAPDRFCSLQFDAANGAGGLFRRHAAPDPRPLRRHGPASRAARSAASSSTSWCWPLKAEDPARSPRAPRRCATPICTRIEAYRRANLHDAGLDPDTVARACRHLDALSARAVPRHRPDRSAAGSATSASRPAAPRSRTPATARRWPRSPIAGASPTRPSSAAPSAPASAPRRGSFRAPLAADLFARSAGRPALADQLRMRERSHQRRTYWEFANGIANCSHRSSKRSSLKAARSPAELSASSDRQQNLDSPPPQRCRQAETSRRGRAGAPYPTFDELLARFRRVHPACAPERCHVDLHEAVAYAAAAADQIHVAEITVPTMK